MTCIVSVPGVFIVKIQKWNPQQIKGKGNKEKLLFGGIPKPNIKEQMIKPIREKSILYTISMTIMHPPATIKCLGEEKTMCNLQTIVVSIINE